MTQPHTSIVKTADGVGLSYTQTGPQSGQQVLFLPGWRQAAAEWRKQFDHFASAGFRVTTLDWRGHGESDKPAHGYRLGRFAADLNDILTQLNLDHLTIVAHSMGCCVTWACWDQYPDARKRIDKLVFVDQPATMMRHPHWTDEEALQLSAIFTPDAVYGVAHNIDTQAPLMVKGMFTDSVAEADYDWVLSENKKMSDALAATLLIDHAFRDWRDVLPRITAPTLVLAGEVSIFPAPGVEWVATQIPGARQYTFTAAEKGSHFVFWENPEKFNSVVQDFITN